MRATKRTPRRPWLVAGLLGLLLAPQAFADRGICATAVVSEPMRLPDGSNHAAGELTLCIERHLTPVTSLHKTRIGGHNVALLTSQRGISEAERGKAPYMMFHRNPDGRLLLYGLALPSDRGTVRYLLNPAPAVAREATGGSAAIGAVAPLLVRAVLH